MAAKLRRRRQTELQYQRLPDGGGWNESEGKLDYYCTSEVMFITNETPISSGLRVCRVRLVLDCTGTVLYFETVHPVSGVLPQTRPGFDLNSEEYRAYS